MGTIAEKLSYLDTTREKILTETNRLGVGLTEQDKFRDYAKGLHDGYVDLINNGTDTLYNNMEKVTGNGSNITLENTEEAPMKSEFEGDTSQESTTGKNLFDKDYTYWNKANTTLTTLETGIRATLTGGSTYRYGTVKIPNSDNLLGKTLTLNYVKSESGNNVGTIRVYAINNDGNTVGSAYNSSTPNTFNMPSTYPTGTTAFGMLFYSNLNGSNASVGDYVDYTNVQLELGETATSYEPYTNGASPNPDYPQPINVVSGRQEVSVVGKNLFNSTIQEGTYNTAVYTIDTDGKINQSATDASSWNANQKRNFKLSAGTYTLRIFGKTSNQNLQIRNITDSTDIITTKNDIVTFTLNSEKTIALKTWGGSSDYPVSYYIELEKGEITDPTYEQYKGQSYEINLGKNLLNVIDTTATSNDITLISSNGEITLNGTASANTSMIVFNDFFYLEAGTYIVSLNNSSSISGSNYFRVLDENYSAVSNAIYFSTANNTLTFTLSTGKKCRCQIRTASGTEYNNYVIKPQLEKGSQATTYAPYKTPIELCKIGTHQDRIYKSNGTWFIEKQVGKVVLNGSEEGWDSFYIESSGLGRAILTGMSNVYYNATQSTIMASNLKGVKYSGSWNNTYDCIASFSTNRFIAYLKNASDLATFKSILNNSNAIVYYVLNTPTTTEITDTELISQLNQWYNEKSRKGTTNISVTSEDLPAILKVIAIKEYE